MLLVEHPPTYAPERAYILRVLLDEFLGLDYRTIIVDRPDIRITNTCDASGELRVADHLFQTDAGDWLTAASMPTRPLDHVECAELGDATTRLPDSIPVIYGRAQESGAYIEISHCRLWLGLDLFGSAFFLLTRYEELVVTKRDRHSRYPAAASLAFQENFLNRPVVDEYAELLWACLSRLFPTLRRRVRTPRINMTFDVDWPLITYGLSLRRVLYASGADIVSRHEPHMAVKRMVSWMHVQRGNLDRDAGNIFGSIMRSSEEQGLQSTFNFIADGGRGDIDGTYNLEHPWIRELIRAIHGRGHVIGLHPTYQTFDDPCRTRKEFTRLIRICAEEGVTQSQWGGRQHYLRWNAPTTWQNYEDAGIAYDSSLGYADSVGFRCGTCHEYPVFNLRTRRALKLRERPLLAMDSTLFGKHEKYGMNLTASKAVSHLTVLKASCERYDGVFTMLWHNNWLLRPNVHAAYHETLRRIDR